MIPKNKNPLEIIYDLLYQPEVERWQKALDENKEQRHKDFCEAYADMKKSNAKLKEALKSKGKV